MRNPESRMIENIFIDDVYKKISAKIEKDEIQPDQFTDLYDNKIIEADKAYVEKMEKTFAENNKNENKIHRLATIFEGIFHEHAELSEWLGPDVITVRCSRYDDIVNGIDSLAKFKRSEIFSLYLGLAIDVTTNEHLEKKFNRIKKEIMEGKLARVKYFISEQDNFRGEISNIPRVVVGADTKTVRDLANLYAEKNNKALSEHPIQFQILEEIITQLDTFEKFAGKHDQQNIARTYEETSKLIKQILYNKLHGENSIKDAGARDTMFPAIENYLAAFV